VWQRELTFLEHAPDWWRQAVGVDTTARLQTVWQVRLLGNAGGAHCTTPDNKVPEWQALIIPSAGRLSIRAEGVPPDLDPCELPPSGGYRGLENQLYRIEIHDGGAVGAATFKWSRDNASVASAVSEIVANTATGTELKLASLGRDAVLRFNTGDWVEILDDRRELTGESGDPALRRGVMRKITVDDDKRTISFSPALPADLIPRRRSATPWPRGTHASNAGTKKARCAIRQQHCPRRSRRGGQHRPDSGAGGGRLGGAGERHTGAVQPRSHWRRIPLRRLLGVRGAQRGCLGGNLHTGAAARHTSPLCASVHRDLPGHGDRLSCPLAAGLRRLLHLYGGRR
jgi:hypothetical protein